MSFFYDEDEYRILDKRDLFSYNRKFLKNKILHNFNNIYQFEFVSDKTRRKLSEINRNGILISNYRPFLNYKNVLLEGSIFNIHDKYYYACKQKQYISFYLKNSLIDRMDYFLKDHNYKSKNKISYLICNNNLKLTNIDRMYFTCKDKSYLDKHKYDRTVWRYYNEINTNKNYDDYLKDFNGLKFLKDEFKNNYSIVNLSIELNKYKIENLILDFINLHIDY